MKIIVDFDSNQLHYIRAILSKEIATVKSNEDHSEYYEDYCKSLKDILSQFK